MWKTFRISVKKRKIDKIKKKKIHDLYENVPLNVRHGRTIDFTQKIIR